MPVTNGIARIRTISAEDHPKDWSFQRNQFVLIHKLLLEAVFNLTQRRLGGRFSVTLRQHLIAYIIVGI